MVVYISARLFYVASKSRRAPKSFQAEFSPVNFIFLLLYRLNYWSSVPTGAAILDRPGEELKLVLHEDVPRGTPFIRVGNFVLNVILNGQDTIDTVGVENVIDEHLQIAHIVLLSLEVNPVVELNGGVRKCVCIYSGYEDVVRTVHIEDWETVDTPRSLIQIILCFVFIHLNEPFFVWCNQLQCCLDSLSHIIVAVWHK